jgi:hypothetical protein
MTLEWKGLKIFFQQAMRNPDKLLRTGARIYLCQNRKSFWCYCSQRIFIHKETQAAYLFCIGQQPYFFRNES